jgi:proton-dependent oligopeptide transporter, POT family
MTLAQRWHDIRTGFERPFWVANISELFERLSYYAVFASLARYLNESLQFPVERAASLASVFGGLVWFLAIFGGATADRLGFRRALSLAYLLLSAAYFLIGSITAPWLAPASRLLPLGLFVGIILALPALGISLVKPCVVGTTAHASKENVRSFGYSIYYTLVNIGGAAGPLVASYVHNHMRVENVFRVAALSVFAMFVVVLAFFREPRKAEDVTLPSVREVTHNFCVVLGNYKLVLPVLSVALLLGIVGWLRPGFVVPWWLWVALAVTVLAGIGRFMWFLVLFTGYWIVYWQEFLTLPLYVHKYVNAKLDTELLLMTGPVVVIALTIVITLLTQKMPALMAITAGTLISALGWIFLIMMPSGLGAVLTLVAVALGEIVMSPRYYDYVSRLAPEGQQGTYMGFAFLPLGIGSLVGRAFGGRLIHHFGEVKHEPAGMWWVIIAIGVATAVLLLVYDKLMMRKTAEEAG